MKKVTCPYCGHEYQENVEEIHEGGRTSLTRWAGQESRTFRGKKCVDLVCPNPKCKREFEFCWEA